MTAIKRKMPRDVNQRAKAIADTIDAILDGDDSALAETDGKDPERVARGKLVGSPPARRTDHRIGEEGACCGVGAPEGPKYSSGALPGP